MTRDRDRKDVNSPEPPEEDQIEAELEGTAVQVRAVLHEPQLDLAFRQRLGAELVAERARLLVERRRRLWPPASRWPSLRLRLAGGGLALAVAAALVLILVRPTFVPFLPVMVNVSSTVSGQASVDPASSLAVHFNRSMDHAAVVAALRIHPATLVRTAWRGDDLVVTPVHGLAPNAAYVISIDGGRARTSARNPLAGDLHLFFGTGLGPEPPGGTAPVPPLPLPVHLAAAAADGSEAVFTGDGSLIATGATVTSDGRTVSGLLSLRGAAAVRLAAATDAICVSRSGRSLAYLVGGGAGAQINMAAGDGSGGRPVPAAVDQGSPLGWIGDEEVSFVSGGLLRAVDRSGQVRTLADQKIDAAHDTLAIAPGGRYAFWGPGAAGGPGQGQMLDLIAHRGNPLAGISGQPAFSSDGATVAWIDGSGPGPRLSSAPSRGGPARKVPLPVGVGDAVSDLALSPDGVHVAYSVKSATGGGELRIATITDGVTVAASKGGPGASPNWSPGGDRVAVQGESGGQPAIQLAALPGELLDSRTAFGGIAEAFANAQISADPGAMRALTESGVVVDGLPHPSRISVVAVEPGAEQRATADLRLVFDAQPGHPIARFADERVALQTDATTHRATVTGVTAGPVHDLPMGPLVTRLASGPTPHSLAVTFNGELEPSSLAGAFQVAAPTEPPLAATVRYDAAARTAIVTLPAAVGDRAQLMVATGLRDVAGHQLADPFRATVALGPG